jgi:hypothetical protein
MELKLKQSDYPEFVRLLSEVLGYYRQDSSKFTTALFWNACQPFDLEQVEKAMQSHCTDAEYGVFAPKVADMVRVLAGTTTDRAALAWGKVLEAMSSVGAYSDVVFDDPAIHAAVEDVGGWVKICRSQTDELSYLQHRFALAYKAYAGRPTFEFQRRLIGDRSPDRDYEMRGLPLPKPAIVGDVDKARAVYRGGNVGGKTSVSFVALDALESPPAKPVLKMLGTA